jgi:phage shock protein E
VRRSTHLALALAAVTAVACTTAAADGGDADPGVRAVPATDAAPLLDDPDVVVLDIRTPAEVAQARLPGAMAIDYYDPTFAQQIEQLDRDATYLMYCRSGNRSSGARALMSQLGFRDVVDVNGGIIEWANAGLPIEQ